MKFSGIIPPMVTPLLGRDELDRAGLERLIERMVNAGVNGLFILGTTGEGPGLSYKLRREVIERTCRQVNGRIPVLVGITDTAFVESVSVAKVAADAGAEALVAAPPYYMPEGQPELQEYLSHLLDELPLPLFIYNMPALTKVPFEVETVRWAVDQPRIIGLKDSSANMIYFHRALELARVRAGWPVLIGPEEMLFDAILAGGHGGVSGGANLFPRLYVKLVEAARAGDLPRALQLHQAVLRVSGSLYRIGRHPSSIIKGIKCALACVGVCEDFLAEPFHRFRSEERMLVDIRVKELQAELEGMGLA
ncbi:MAG TPA: dihydrodipicolinate synthase family protein [Verrucomicrobiae bacterium]|nr:dihydrodipicolinate synthase family protein [Verrucomicrobiae bacterium]